MSVHLNPYLGFRDTARAALTFYQAVLGGQLNLMTFGDNGMNQDPAEAAKIMHGQLDAPNGMTLMASDTPNSMDVANTSNISVSLSGDDAALLTGYWHGLIEGGTAVIPLAQAPWGDTFGMLRDKFGIAWMINIAGKR